MKIEKQYNTVHNGGMSSSSLNVEKTLDAIIEAVNSLIQSRGEEKVEICGKFIQASLMGNITCANPKPCSLHDKPDIPAKLCGVQNDISYCAHLKPCPVHDKEDFAVTQEGDNEPVVTKYRRIKDYLPDETTRCEHGFFDGQNRCNKCIENLPPSLQEDESWKDWNKKPQESWEDALNKRFGRKNKMTGEYEDNWFIEDGTTLKELKEYFIKEKRRAFSMGEELGKSDERARLKKEVEKMEDVDFAREHHIAILFKRDVLNLFT